MKSLLKLVFFGTFLHQCLFMSVGAQQDGNEHVHQETSLFVSLQPLAQQVRRIEAALNYLGQPLSALEHQAINHAIAKLDEIVAVQELQQILDKHVLAIVEINPESRVKVQQGLAQPTVFQQGTKLFLVKILNKAGVTAPLEVESPNSGPVYIRSQGSPEPNSRVTFVDVRDRWAEISLYQKPPMQERLSGLGIEYQLLEVYSRDKGQRSAQISFNVGQGTQDIGFRNNIIVLFNAVEAYPVRLQVLDEEGEPTVARFLIRDHLKRLYPNPSKRLAPDFPFQPHIYRADGDIIQLPKGTYTVTSSRGPEYIPQTKSLQVGGEGEHRISFELQRWINPSLYAWYSGDHHIHAAGCSHYENPTEGVLPEAMWKQIQGEALNVGSVLTWGPCYYYQKQFFTGQDHALSKPNQLIHYDLEVSGFPSSHSGHLVLLALTDQDYPGTRRIEDWPTWDLPILRWGKAQNAVTGFAHSGWGLAVKSRELPNYEMPGFDGIGANEYIVDVTHLDSVDFISAGDTPYVWELNIWYHTLNTGFRTRISGETDFPCITDDQVGLARSYAKVDGQLTYRAWVDAVRDGRSYVSDGKSHLIDFKVNGVSVGEGDSQVHLAGSGRLKVSVQVGAYLDVDPRENLQNLPYDEKPYWEIERARVGTSQDVPLELIVNGEVAAMKRVAADGKIRLIQFDVPIEQSSWIALRILPSSHTNPIFALVDEKPIRASRRSAQWCLDAVNQCWTQKARGISTDELPQARRAYDHARSVYERILGESVTP